METSCGDYSQPCCAGGHCTNNDSYCENETCIQCSFEGQQCCPFGTPLGMECQPGLTCVSGLCAQSTTSASASETNWLAIAVAGGLAIGAGALIYAESKRGYY